MGINYLIISVIAISIFFMIASLYDLKFKKIPNILCLFILIFGIGVRSIFNGFDGLFDAMINISFIFAILFPLFAFKVIGAGDVKLMMAISSLSFFETLLYSLLYSPLFALLFSIFIAIYRQGFEGVLKTLLRYYRCFLLKIYIKPQQGEAASVKVPYAPALFAGWILSCSQSDQILSAFSEINAVNLY